MDSDVVFVQSRQIVPLSIRPQTTADMTVYIEPGWYSYGEYHRFWPGSNSKTFVAPTEVGVAVFELVYIDATTGYPGYVRGVEFPLDYVMDFADFTPDIPQGAGAIGYVLLQYDQTEITNDDIIDVRALMDVLGGPLHLSEGLTVTGNVIVTGGDVILSNGRVEYQTPLWDDVPVTINNARIPTSNAPTWTSYKGGQVLAFGASSDEILYFTAQLPHWYKESSDLEFHLHLSYPNGNAGYSMWRMTHSWCNITGAFPTQTIVTGQAYAPGVADMHQLFELAETIDGTDKTISSILLCSLERVGTDVVYDTYGSSVYLTSMDFHIQKDTSGSREELKK